MCCETCCSMTGYAEQWTDYGGLAWNNNTWETNQCYDNFGEVFDGTMDMRKDPLPNPTNAKPPPMTKDLPHKPISMATVGFTLLHRSRSLPPAVLAARRVHAFPRCHTLLNTSSLLHTTHRTHYLHCPHHLHRPHRPHSAKRRARRCTVCVVQAVL